MPESLEAASRLSPGSAAGPGDERGPSATPESRAAAASAHAPEHATAHAPEPAHLSPHEARRVVAVTLRIGAILLGAGSGTEDVEEAMRRVAHALGLDEIQIGISFQTISVSFIVGHSHEPITAIRIVRERVQNYTRLAAVATLSRDLASGATSVADAPARLDEIEAIAPPWPRWFVALAMGALAMGSTILFGGGPMEAALAIVVGVIVQPIVAFTDDLGLPPFFHKAIGPLISTLLIVIALKAGLPVIAAPVIAGTLQRFLPGAALVAGTRDLIGQWILSGTARLMEAILFGVAVALGLVVALGIAVAIGVNVQAPGTGDFDWPAPALIAAAGIASGSYAIRVGVPRWVLGSASLLGAAGYAGFLATRIVTGDSIIGTFVAAAIIGFVGRLFAKRWAAPILLWVVPDNLPLLPGVRLVRGFLLASTAEGPGLMIGAVLTAFVLGIGVAVGDIVEAKLTEARHRVTSLTTAEPAGGTSAGSSGDPGHEPMADVVYRGMREKDWADHDDRSPEGQAHA